MRIVGGEQGIYEGNKEIRKGEGKGTALKQEKKRKRRKRNPPMALLLTLASNCTLLVF